jgi:Flp pilus assembly protein TadG
MAQKPTRFASRPVLSCLRDRRGAIAVAFAVGSTAVLGMVALATEGGVWYAARRNAQTAADMGAFAGVAQLAWRGQDSAGQTLALNAGRGTAASNGFTNDRRTDGTAGRTRVDVQVGVWDAAAARFVPTTSSPTAVQVEVRQIQRLGIAGIFANDPPVVNVRAVATIKALSSACILSLTGQTTITGNNTLNAPDCAIASNRPGESIDCGQNASRNMDVLGLIAVGTASAPCDNTGAQIFENQISLADPYQYVRNAWLANPPSIRNNDCQDVDNRANPRRNSIVQPDPDGSGSVWRPLPYNNSALGGGTVTAICDDVKIQAGDQMILTPGTYFFADANLQITGGQVSCPTCTNGQGVTLVFTQISTGAGGTRGNNRIGTIQVTGGDIQLTAPTAGPWYTDPVTRENPLVPGTTEATSIFDGMLVFRDPRAIPNNTKNVDNLSNPNTARITGNSDTINMDGGFYLPTTQIFVGGTPAVATNVNDCQSIVGATIQVTGNSTLDVRGCAQRGTNVARTRVIRLVN